MELIGSVESESVSVSVNSEYITNETQPEPQTNNSTPLADLSEPANNNNNNNNELPQPRESRNIYYYNISGFNRLNIRSYEPGELGNILERERIGSGYEERLRRLINFSNTSNPNTSDNISNLIKKYTKTPTQSDILAQENCPICFNEFDNNNLESDPNIGLTCQLGCSHCFHSECVGNWLVKNKSCPVCRTKCAIYNQETNEFKPDLDAISISESRILRRESMGRRLSDANQSLLGSGYMSTISYEDPIIIRTGHMPMSRYFSLTPAVYRNNVIVHDYSSLYPTREEELSILHHRYNSNSNYRVMEYNTITGVSTSVNARTNENQMESLNIIPPGTQITWITISDSNTYSVYLSGSNPEQIVGTVGIADVELVMEQTRCTIERAIKALINSDYNVVDAILNLAA